MRCALALALSACALVSACATSSVTTATATTPAGPPLGDLPACARCAGDVLARLAIQPPATTGRGVLPRQPPPPAVPPPRGRWGDDDVIHVFRAARHAWNSGDFTRAADQLALVITERPDHYLAPLCAHLLLDSLDAVGRDRDLAAWLDRLFSDPRVRLDTDERQLLEYLASELTRWRADRAVERADFATCADLHLDLVARHPRAATADEHLFAAAACLERDGDHGACQHVLRDLLERAPDGGYATTARAWIATRCPMR